MKSLSSQHIGAVVISTVIVVAFSALVVALAVHAVVESTTLTTILTLLGSKFSTVVDYFLGSSRQATAGQAGAPQPPVA